MSLEAERLGRVVSNMLDLARLERNTPFTEAREGDLGRAVEARVEQQRDRLENAGMEVELEIEADLPPALFDPDAIDQILDNLLDNAEKHTRGLDGRRVTVSVQEADRQLRVVVADNGHGVPRSQRRTMFRPFDRAEGEVGRPGLGLGLAVARSLAHAQGGSLELGDSHHGATFILTLPTA